ncbi:MAG: acyltransferase [Rikenellaceae bacterium]
MFSIDEILSVDSASFEDYALRLFKFQAENCVPYRDYIALLGVDVESVKTLNDIPFLPIELFKTHKIYCSKSEPEIIFTSSNTGGANPSKHYMAHTEIYEKAFLRAFEIFYSSPRDVSIYGLLPNYLEREGSSLVYMVDSLIKQNKYGRGGFYLDNYQALIEDMASDSAPKILLGVSYALWDLAEQYPGKVAGENTIIMETGGMKGRREELSKDEFHAILTSGFGCESIHSEYGMAELTSQAYSFGGGIFRAPGWMKILIRDLNNPFAIGESTRGGVNIIDLANIYSCAFIQTQDIGRVFKDGTFSILGRNEHSEIRGCNLLVASR